MHMPVWIVSPSDDLTYLEWTCDLGLSRCGIEHPFGRV